MLTVDLRKNKTIIVSYKDFFKYIKVSLDGTVYRCNYFEMFIPCKLYVDKDSEIGIRIFDYVAKYKCSKEEYLLQDLDDYILGVIIKNSKEKEIRKYLQSIYEIGFDHGAKDIKDRLMQIL